MSDGESEEIGKCGRGIETVAQLNDGAIDTTEWCRLW